METCAKCKREIGEFDTCYFLIEGFIDDKDNWVSGRLDGDGNWTEGDETAYCGNCYPTEE